MVQQRKRRVESSFHFQGFHKPRFTSVPDDFFDILAPELSEAELRVLLYIIRRTFGFKKDSDNISLKQLVEGIKTRDGKVLDKGSGLSKSAAARGVSGLVKKGIIVATRNSSAERGDEPTTYELRFVDDPVSLRDTRGYPSEEQGGALQKNTQDTVLQETEIQDTDLSNVRNTSRPINPIEDDRPSRGASLRRPGPSDTEPSQLGDDRNSPSLAEVSPDPEGTTPGEAQDGETPAIVWQPRRRGEPVGADHEEEKGTASGGGFGASHRSSAAHPAPGGEAGERQTPETVPTPDTPVTDDGLHPSKPATSGFSSVADVMAGRMEKDGSTGLLRSQKRSSEDRQVILDYIADFARELGDEAPLSSSVQRAHNLYQRSGLSIGSFTSLLYEARSTTQEYSANIKKQRTGDSNPFGPRKVKMAYFFSILEKLVPGGETGESSATGHTSQ